MQAVHELGHVSVTLATGGTVTKVILHPLTISRTDSSGSLHPLLVIWAGPVIGVALPLALLAVFKVAKLKWDYLVQFFAGTCLIANGAYIAAGSFQKIGDAGDLIRHGSPIGLLWSFGLVTVPLGLWLWNGLDRVLGLEKPGPGRSRCGTVFRRPASGSRRAGVGLQLVFQAAHAAATLAHAATARTAGKLFHLAGRMGAGTLNDFVRCVLPQEGQTGFSSPRINSSKSLPQSVHEYS